jgi:hypothetical protein
MRGRGGVVVTLVVNKHGHFFMTGKIIVAVILADYSLIVNKNCSGSSCK